MPATVTVARGTKVVMGTAMIALGTAVGTEIGCTAILNGVSTPFKVKVLP